MIANKQTNMWNKDFGSIESMEKEAKQSKHVKAEAKQMKQKLGFLGSGLHMQEHAFMCRQDYAYASSCPKSPKNITKPKTLNLKP